MISTEQIAEICHEANRAYCLSQGDASQSHWNEAPEWQKQSAVKGVEGILQGTITTPAQSHESWLKEKRETGWKYGAAKNPEAKEHPCFVEYEELPPAQRFKDSLFFNIVKTWQ